MSLQAVLDNGYRIMAQLSQLTAVPGVLKLLEMVRREVAIFEEMKAASSTNDHQIASTNLWKFVAVADYMREKEVDSIQQPFTIMEDGKILKRVHVDVICKKSRNWVKIIVRNPQSITLAVMGNAKPGEKTIVDQAKDYLQVAQRYNVAQSIEYYMIKVLFYFANGIEFHLARYLQNMGVIVEGEILTDLPCKLTRSYLEFCSEQNKTEPTESGSIGPLPPSFMNAKSMVQQTSDYVTSLPSMGELSLVNANLLNVSNNKELDGEKLNLDITAMIGFVSRLTNGGECDVLTDKILNTMAGAERARPLKPILVSLFKGKDLICCKTAMDSFLLIVEKLGGPGERERTSELVSQVTVVLDEPRSDQLQLRGGATERSSIIFSTGAMHKATTVTANKRFILAARHQGIEYSAAIHEPRALTESKIIPNLVASV